MDGRAFSEIDLSGWVRLQVPLADHRGLIADFPQQFGKRLLAPVKPVTVVFETVEV